MNAVEFKNVSFSYDEETGVEVIKDVSLEIKQGEFVCVLGQNGSGKSTLARLINGLLSPQSGEIFVFDKNVADKKNLFEIRKSVGMVFQNPDNQMVATMVEDDIAFGPENLGLPSKEIGERIDFALNSTGMQEYRFSQGQKLSGGQKQRVAIAGVLAIMPKIIILDESTSMLDSLGRKEVMDVVKALNKEGMTVICITHYMDESVEADRVIVMSDGHIVKDGTPTQIFKSGLELNSYGLELPKCTYIANRLAEKGLPIKRGILTSCELMEELCKLFQKA